MQLSVYNAAYGKFQRCYDCAACQASENQAACFGFDVHDIYEHIGESARQRHCPVRESAERNLNKAVNYSAEQINK